MDRTFEIGEKVTLIAIPTAVESDPTLWQETQDLFAAAKGGTFTVQGFNRCEMAELWMTPEGRDSSNPCDDSVWVEVHCLHKAGER